MSADGMTRSLVAALVRDGVLAGSIDELIDMAGSRGEQLVADGRVSEARRLEALAGLLHLEYVNLPPDYRITDDMLDMVSAERIRRFGIVPLGLSPSGALRLVGGYPYDAELEDVLHRLTGRAIQLALCETDRIRNVLSFNQLDGRILDTVSAGLQVAREDGEGETRSYHLDQDEGDPVVRLVNQLCRDAIQRKASDIHIHTSATGLEVKYRVDGVLLPSRLTIGTRYAAQLTSRIKIMGGMDIAERSLPQDGRFRLTDGEHETDMRVSLLPAAQGEDVVVRLLDRNTLARAATSIGLSDLGLDPEIGRRLVAAINEPFGMVLVTGPTGSGKTTTLYAALNDSNDGLAKIITIEDPVEYQLPGITQIPINEKKGLTFVSGLRSILRHDPDKIMVGEIRDSQTADIAVQAALTGHLVFSTVHANSALDVIGRLTHMGVGRYNLVTALKCILAQRLLRKVCGHCARQRPPTPEESDLIARQGLPEPSTIMEPVGCDHCMKSGYAGRFAIAEFIYLGAELSQKLIDQVSLGELEDTVRKQGTGSLRYMALKAVTEGKTTLAEVNRMTQGEWQA